MGVQGLWTLISPVARPINLETMGSKKLAIDSSIWLYQFQKAMRDREGKAIVNSHILGFLRRISKLLYYGIKPVFVFDGGVPTLKRQTINERKRRKRGVQDNLAKTAEKLLAAQLRQVAVMEAQKRSEVKSTGDLITKDTVYFDDQVAQDFSEKNTIRKKRRSDPTEPTTIPEPSPTKKPRFVPKDQYQLPPIDNIPSVTESGADHRLATEMELKQFIHEFTPEDLDINSPHFQSLSTELKYEIIGDLRIKSRQPNRTRVEAMRKTNDHEFSQTQILNLKKRNDLTQKLLTVTDMVAKANLTIPIKIAAQRNKEYVLVKASEGWILGIENDNEKKDTGSAKNPVQVDEESEDEDVEFEEVKIDEPAGRLLTGKQRSSDSEDEVEFEKVSLPPSSSKLKQPTRQQQEADWREAIRFHYGTKDSDSVVAVEESHAPCPKNGTSLFRQPDEEEEDDVMRDIISELVAHESSGHSGPAHDLGEGSSKGTASMTTSNKPNEIPKRHFSTSSHLLPAQTEPQPNLLSQEVINEILDSVELEVDDDFLFSSNTPPRIPQVASKPDSIQHILPYPEKNSLPEADNVASNNREIRPESDLQVLSDNTLTQVALPPVASTITPPSEVSGMAHGPDPEKSSVLDSSRIQSTSDTNKTAPEHPEETPQELCSTSQITLSMDPSTSSNLRNISSPQVPLPSEKSVNDHPISPSKMPGPKEHCKSLIPPIDLDNPKDASSQQGAVDFSTTAERLKKASPERNGDNTLGVEIVIEPEDVPASEADVGTKRARSGSLENPIPWSRTPTPERSMEKDAGSDEEEFDRVIEAEEQALEANLALESTEWDKFLSGLEEQEKLEGIRQEVDLEVARLKAQKVKDRRDADDVNIQMSVDIQNLLKLFGIPFVVSPMEAEAQCAELLKLGLVDGIITDDSDVFLFGGDRIYKNLFNQNKFVECYLRSDLNQELGLDQHKLIQLAFLLGSDYTVGLNGVGPVTAMEILAEFDASFSFTTPSNTSPQQPDLAGLVNFKKWWEKVQVGKDTERESGSAFKKKFRKKKDKIWIDHMWPNPEVADAYLNPIVDHSTEKFVWGLPDLEGIREFLYDHLDWTSVKTDEVIVPLIKRQTQRMNGTVQTQGVLDGYFEYSIETNKASRLATSRIDGGFSSQRLQKIVQNWRQKKKKKQVEEEEKEEEAEEAASGEEEEERSSCGTSKDEDEAARSSKKASSKSRVHFKSPHRTSKQPRAGSRKAAHSGSGDTQNPSSSRPAQKPTLRKKKK
ncbi:hypothetical protein PCASD_04486 [Puccinia coronata f. sp. avenae]|uniref:Uncharacterized protein n=1 Tax=Puccinia coronata f. sp. avenae TaxID=200324 RepID=A0A2N5V353_9BASI|nr:hypothetical protein PCASD_04486 [Puccinia coronata f. sp. avenae]